MAETLEGRVLLSTSVGLSAPVSYNTGTTADGFIPNAEPIGVVSANIDGDTKLDLIVAHRADNSVYFLKGNGDGTFQPAVQIPVGQAFQGDVFVDDFNHDGKPDLLLISSNLDQPLVMLGNGNGTFQTAIASSSFAYSGYYPRGWTVGDFNGDGKLDIACTLPSETSNTGRYEVLLGNGNGTFQTAIVGPAVLGYSRWVTTGDFNHDGKLDLAIADGQGTSGNTANVELTILQGNGDGTFTLGGHYASPQFPDGTDTAAVSNPEDVVVADVNNDNKLDVIESDYDNTINVFLGNGDGTFQPAKSFDPGNYPRDVIPVDINHDGKVDLVVTNVGINTGGASRPRMAMSQAHWRCCWATGMALSRLPSPTARRSIRAGRPRAISITTGIRILPRRRCWTATASRSCSTSRRAPINRPSTSILPAHLR